MFTFGKLIELSVIAIKGIQADKRVKRIEPSFILFSDGKTYIDLEEIDVYSYSEFPNSARYINVKEAHPDYWTILLTYPDATADI